MKSSLTKETPGTREARLQRRREYQREYQRQWRLDKREHLKAYRAKWVEANQARVRAYNAKHARTERCRERRGRWKRENPGRVRAYHQRYKDRNRDECRHQDKLLKRQDYILSTLVPGEPVLYQRIAWAFDVSIMRVMQIEARALQKLRKRAKILLDIDEWSFQRRHPQCPLAGSACNLRVTNEVDFAAGKILTGCSPGA